MLASGELGVHRGLPVTMIATTLAELTAGAGHVVTGGGSVLPMRDLIRMASHAHHYLAVFDDNGRALHLGRMSDLLSARSRRICHGGAGGARTRDQWIMSPRL